MTDEHGADQPDDGGASAPPNLLCEIDAAEALRRAQRIAHTLRGMTGLGGIEHMATHLQLAYEAGKAHGLREAVEWLREATLGGAQPGIVSVPYRGGEEETRG